MPVPGTTPAAGGWAWEVMPPAAHRVAGSLLRACRCRDPGDEAADRGVVGGGVWPRLGRGRGRPAGPQRMPPAGRPASYRARVAPGQGEAMKG